MATSNGTTHRLCLTSWELLSTFKGAVIPRVGETVMIERAGAELAHRVTAVRYKLDAASAEWVATVFVEPT